MKFFCSPISKRDYFAVCVPKIILPFKLTGVITVTVKRGEIYYADLSPVIGSEQGGTRPVLIVQNDVGNKFSPTVIAAAITSQRFKTSLPTHIRVNADGCGLAKDSIVLLEQVRTLDKKAPAREDGESRRAGYDEGEQSALGQPRHRRRIEQ